MATTIPAWQQANRTDATQVRTLFLEPEDEGRRGVCPFCGSEESLHAYEAGGFHCFGECGGPSGQTYTNTEVVSKARDVDFDEARGLICDLS